jgi:hypothetical protein
MSCFWWDMEDGCIKHTEPCPYQGEATYQTPLTLDHNQTKCPDYMENEEEEPFARIMEYVGW